MGIGRRRTRLAFAVSLVSVCALLTSACTPNADASPDLPEQVSGGFGDEITGKLDSTLENAMKLAGASGAVAGVWAPWAGSWVATPGTTTLDGSVPMSTDMHFRIGTTTRAMTCTVLLALADEGVVKLDDPVTKYLPRVGGIDGITLEELCQSTSGLADYWRALKPRFINTPERVWPPLELFSDGRAVASTNAPGEVYADSNTGFVLLGMALEAATDRSWADLYDSYIFSRLGMDSTSFPSPNTLKLPGPHPDGYATTLDINTAQPLCDDVRDETRASNSLGYTAGGVVSTLSDLKTFVQALAAGSLVSKESAKQQWKTIKAGKDAAEWNRYGLGVREMGPLRGHDGHFPGFISAMFSDPESGLTIVVMLNNSSPGSYFAEMLALTFAAIVAGAPAKDGNKQPTLKLPWDAAYTTGAMKAQAICQEKPAAG